MSYTTNAYNACHIQHMHIILVIYNKIFAYVWKLKINNNDGKNYSICPQSFSFYKSLPFHSTGL